MDQAEVAQAVHQLAVGRVCPEKRHWVAGYRVLAKSTTTTPEFSTRRELAE